MPPEVEKMRGLKIYVTGSWKIYLFGTSKLVGKTQIKILTNSLKLIFFAYLDKATIEPSCCEVSHP